MSWGGKELIGKSIVKEMSWEFSVLRIEENELRRKSAQKEVSKAGNLLIRNSVCWGILRYIFDVWQNNLIKAVLELFPLKKKGSFGPPAVSIRVKGQWKRKWVEKAWKGNELHRKWVEKKVSGEKMSGEGRVLGGKSVRKKMSWE
jgi:hypothetical protein